MRDSVSKRERWEAKWRDSDFAPWWKGCEIPDHLVEATESFDIPETSRWLDVGCGDGRLTCALARQTAICIGIDFSQAAIARARALAADTGSSASFRVADATLDIILGGPFDVIHDRGCLHTMDEALLWAYGTNMRRNCTSSGLLFIAHKLDTQALDLESRLVSGLAGNFRLLARAPIVFGSERSIRPGFFFVFQAIDDPRSRRG